MNFGESKLQSTFQPSDLIGEVDNDQNTFANYGGSSRTFLRFVQVNPIDRCLPAKEPD